MYLKFVETGIRRCCSAGPLAVETLKSRQNSLDQNYRLTSSTELAIEADLSDPFDPKLGFFS